MKTRLCLITWAEYIVLFLYIASCSVPSHFLPFLYIPIPSFLRTTVLLQLSIATSNNNNLLDKKSPMLRRVATPITFQRTFFGSAKPQSYRISRVLNGSPEQVYAIVSEVDKYKHFVPFVEDSFITARDANSLPSRAGLKVGWKDITERFECELQCAKNEKVYAKSIELDLFHSLETLWTFKNIKSSGPPKCKVDFTLTYKFKNPLYEQLSSLFAPKVSSIMIGAFEKRLMQLSFENTKNNRQTDEAKL